mmetsp:Transcript_29490/g.44796  ORF Transcript_29490/g.44796 Transcript_29490/m.44796 type:complete len:144 (-) Transcript_29490:6269-6700(-)
MKSKYLSSFNDDEPVCRTTLNKPCQGLKALENLSEDRSNELDPSMGRFEANSVDEDDLDNDFVGVDQSPDKNSSFSSPRHEMRREVYSKYDEENKISDMQTQEQKKEQTIIKKLTSILDSVKRAAQSIPSNRESIEESFMFIR